MEGLPLQRRRPHGQRRTALKLELSSSLKDLQRHLRTPLYANAFWTVVARFYAADEVGIASAVISATVLLSSLSSLGLGTGLIRFLPGAGEAANWMLDSGLTFLVITSLIAAGIFLAGLPLWSPALMSLYSQPILLISFVLSVPLTTLSTVTNQVFVAHRVAKFALLCSIIVSVLKISFPVLLVHCPMTSDTALGIFASVGIAVGMSSVIALTRFLPVVQSGYFPRPRLRMRTLYALIPYSIGNQVAALLIQTPQIILPIMVLNVLGARDSAYAYVAWMLANLIFMISASISTSAFAEGSNEEASMGENMRKALHLTAALSIPAVLLILAMRDRLLTLFGGEYAEHGASLLTILALSALPVGVNNIYFAVERVTGKIKTILALSVFIAGSTLILSYFLMPRCGIAGAGIGWLMSQGVAAGFTICSALLKKVCPPQGTDRMPIPYSGPTGFDWNRRENQMDNAMQTHHLKIVAAIPCYNEEQFISGVVCKASQYVDLVIVVDDGSSDQTAEVAAAAGALVVRHEVNRGYGEAIRSCFRAALDNDADVLVTIDGDGQHNADELPNVLQPILAGDADLVIGNRFMGKATNVPRYRKFGIDVITFLYNFGAKVCISDAQSGFRAYRRAVLNAVELTERGMGVSVQILIQARRKGYSIKEVPISCRYHSAGSTLNPVRHGVGVALTVVKLRLASAVTGG